MTNKNLSQVLMSGGSRSLYTTSVEPKLIELNRIKTGDEVVLWNDSGLTEEKLVEKGKKYIVDIIDVQYQMISLAGVTRMYKSDNTEYEIGWEYWRFCLPKDYSEASICLIPEIKKYPQVTKFAGRQIYSKYHVLDIPAQADPPSKA